MTTKDEIIQLLSVQDMTVKQLAKELGINEESTRQHLRMMGGVARICAWNVMKNTYAAVWGLGSEPHLPKPLSRDQKAMQQRLNYYKRTRKDIAFVARPYFKTERVMWGVPGGL